MFIWLKKSIDVAAQITTYKKHWKVHREQTLADIETYN